MDNENKETLLHYGVKRRSGRYPWGSGDDGFIGKYDSYRSQGLSEKDIATKFGMNTSELRSAKAIANEERKHAMMETFKKMSDEGMTGAQISRETGVPSRTVTAYLSQKEKVRSNQIDSTATQLKSILEQRPYMDIGVGVEKQLHISNDKLKAVVKKMEEEGYTTNEIYIPQIGNPGKWTTVKVLTKGKSVEDIREHRSEIQPPDIMSEDGGLSFQNLREIKPVTWNRVGVRYAEDGGLDRDGVVLIRPGAKDLDLGDSKYAQIRIAVGKNERYVKGMAMYGEPKDFPDGVDIMFNTNKSKDVPKKEVFKKMGSNPDNPFGATIVDQKGAFNIVNQEGDWASWKDSKFAAQFLAKQPKSLVHERLDATHSSLKKEYDEIMSVTNPTVKKKLLDEFADNVDSKARSLKVQGLPNSRPHVLIPFPGMKENEVYAPNYKDGDSVVLVRYPHGGTFEIPELRVNNRYPPAKKSLGTVADAIGIHPSVAHKLSGADFDGDTVMVIKNNNKKIRSTQSLAGLKDFDPNMYQVDHQTVTDRKKQMMMGEVSNLITDMTIKGATTSELTRAVKHSMVVIDSEKHKLDWKQSAEDNAIGALRKKYQTRPSMKYDEDSGEIVFSNRKAVGASTLLSNSKKTVKVPVRVKNGPNKGAYILDKDGKKKTTDTPVMDLVSDANVLVSKPGTAVEREYADYINKLKVISSNARKNAVKQKAIPYSSEAKKLYSDEVKSLRMKIDIAQSNAPRERRAQLIANDTYSKRVSADMTKDQKKKLKGQALAAGRVKAGAQKARIHPTDKEWEAIQSGAVSKNMLEDILSNADMDKIKLLATPRPHTKLTPSKLSKARMLIDKGYSYADVAESLGVSRSTLYNNLGGVK